MTSASPTPTNARISIIGAGPGGLTCARILQRHGIAATVYESDADSHTRNQGGTLDLHADDGQIALREAGLLEEFFERCRPEGQEMREYSPAGDLLTHQVPEPGERFKPEIDRGVLRDMLLNSLEPDAVRWDHRLARVTGPDTGPRTLHFCDGTTVETDLVIAADGAWSKVRPAASPTLPAYTGVTFLEAWFDDVEDRHPEIAGLVGQGGAHAGDGVRGLFAQRNSGDHVRIYIIQQAPVDWISQAGLKTTDTAALRAHLLAEYAGWSPELQRLVGDNDGAYVDRPIYALPVSAAWEHNSTITLLGDAAHLMPPLGVGVNLAMLDASDLALALTNESSIDEAIRSYEATMKPRSTDIATMLHGRAADLLGGTTPDFSDDQD